MRKPNILLDVLSPNIWSGRGLSKDLGVRLVGALVWGALICGAGAWTLFGSDGSGVVAAGMWVWRGMLGVGWGEGRAGASILSELDVKKELLGRMMTLGLAYFGHVVGGGGGPLTLRIVEGMVEGGRKGGRRRKQWFDDIGEWAGLGCVGAGRGAQDGSAWRRTIKRCAEGGRQSSGVTAAAR